MNKKSDRRKSQRIALFGDFPVLDTKTTELIGYVRDISSNGMMVVGSLAPVVGRVYEITVALPEPIDDGNILQVEASCRWHTVDVKRGFHKSGFQLGELAEREQHIIEQIQADYEFSTSETGS